MAITNTVLSSAKALNDLTIAVGSATGFAVGNVIRIDNEFLVQTGAANGTTIPVAGGREGRAQVAHAKNALVSTGLASDFPTAPHGEDIPVPAAQVQGVVTYGVAGAIALPTTISHTLVRLLTGTAGAMTLASPGLDIEGAEMTIMAMDAQAYTVTCTAGFGGGTTARDVATFAGVIGNSMLIRASAGVWNVRTLTSVTLG